MAVQGEHAGRERGERPLRDRHGPCLGNAGAVREGQAVHAGVLAAAIADVAVARMAIGGARKEAIQRPPLRREGIRWRLAIL